MGDSSDSDNSSFEESSSSSSCDETYSSRPRAMDARPLSALPRVDAGNTAPATRAFDTVTYKIDQVVPVSVLRTQPDGGKQLVLEHGNGIGEGKHSNLDHRRPEAYAQGHAIDFVKSVTLRMRHNLSEPVVVTTNIPAMAHESANVLDKTTITKEHPHGLLGFEIPVGKEFTEKTIQRAFTDGQLKFVSTYPNQTAQNLEKWVHPLASNPDKMHVRAARPESAILHFYNALPEIAKEGKQITAEHADKEGYAYAEREPLQKAMELARVAMGNMIAYANVKDPAQQRLTLSLARKNIDRKSVV